jgi:hypothetical protein
MVKQYRHEIDDWGTKIVLGNAGSIKHYHKFGRNTAVGTTEEDVWNVGGIETLLTAPASMYASCEAAGATSQVISVEGLDENWELKTETVTLNGQNQVIIGAASSWTRIFRAFQVSAEPDPNDNVWIAESDTLTLGVPNTASKIHALVEYPQAAQQTEKCMVTIPAGHIGLFYGFSGSVLNALTGAARDASVFIEVQQLAAGATVASPSWTPFRRIDEHGLSTDAQITVTEEYPFPLLFEELTNIHMRATASASSVVYGDFNIIFVRR